MKKLLKFQTGGKTLPTAPPAEQRYKGGKRVLNSSQEFGDSVSVRGVEAPSAWYEHPAQIVERIRHSKVSPIFNDTVYVERPSFIKPIHGVTRAAGNDYYYGKKKRYQLPIFGDFVHNNYDKSTPEEQKEYDTLKRRFNTAWSVSSKQEGGTIDEPSGKFNNALFNLGIGAADSGLFASMLHKDGGVLKGQKGLQAKSDNTRVSKIPNKGEAIYRNPEDENWALDFVPILGTIRAAERYDHNGHPGDLVDAGISGAMDLLGAKMIGAVVKAAGKASKIHKALKARGYKQIGAEPTHWYPKGYNPNRYDYMFEPISKHYPEVKSVPNVDYYNVAMQPMIQSLRVPFEAPFKYSAYQK